MVLWRIYKTKGENDKDKLYRILIVVAWLIIDIVNYIFIKRN